MAKINVLDKHVAELIAAGEVVERPSSVIKELVENSVDAGATVLTVEIKNGGTTFMRVTDNGCGIAREDVPTAFLRHATSKVHHQDDLESIATLGFRGEALASIAAVSRVELLTRTADELAGTRYGIAGGEEEFCEDAGCAQGTTFVVRDIFFNTPARMKFLKKDVTEANAIASVMDRLALSHPEVSVRMIRDGKETLHTPGDGKLKSAVYAVFGKEFTNGLMPVEYAYNGVSVSGFVSKPAAARPNRSMQHFFINGRYVKSRTAMAALEEAFKGSLMVGKMPACVLHLEIPYQTVDVNVHPAKIEVRFINERPIFDAVYHGVKTALNQWDAPSVMKLHPASPAAPFPQTKSEAQTVLTPQKQETVSIRQVEPMQPEQKIPMVEAERFRAAPVQTDWTVRDSGAPSGLTHSFGADIRKADITGPEEEEPPVQYMRSGIDAAKEPPSPTVSEERMEAVQAELPLVPEKPPAKLAGEAFGTYILLERGDELVVIDKHAAHERMLYEELKANGEQALPQLLLQPIPVTLEKNEYAAVLNAMDLYEKAGFELEDFGEGTVLVRSAPLILGGEDVADAVMEIAGYLQSSKNDLTTEKLDWLYHNVACRAAVKAGDESRPEELLALAERLEQNPNIRYCPHGRPVSIVLKKRDLEKQFGRI
ncbi:DNA mismatch repair endonuclease MutL [Anaeromassilibacillus senegalensis]|uniref:DNA mismatch repair endonuclease MutL n=1 Tax=Anaeromassilibacillus senegalensis TaxID=1673717 RepID=UPI000682C069|nr:DNA mismatch repair endonuclease MutL [Anaeromassilibacillus senegalensis]